MSSSARNSRRRSSTRSSQPLERTIAHLRARFPAFGNRPLGWDDALELAELLDATVQIRTSMEDAFLLTDSGGARIVVSDRLYLPTWGVFCVAHELGHWLLHPGARQYYLGSPGWLDKTESQANLIGLLALWPRPAPYPRILKIEEGEGVVQLYLALTSPGRDRKLSLRRYK